MVFRDRHDAGRRLAARLPHLVDRDVVVVALPRGGVPVAAEVADALHAPLEILAVRKLGAPGNPEYGIGAITEDGTAVVDREAAAAAGMTPELFDRTLEEETTELRRRVARYRDDRPPADVRGRTVVLVDDGLATGRTDLAAVRALRRRGAATIVVAVPVASSAAVELLEQEAEEVVAVDVPPAFAGVGQWYRDFRPVPDEEVVDLLAARRRDEPEPAAAGAALPPPIVEEVGFAVDGVRLTGDLTIPSRARGLVLFAHGSGSSRRSTRNRAVARDLAEEGFATLLFDLLSDAESGRRELVFNVEMLGGRLRTVAGLVRSDPRLAALPLGYFGASTGAAAALIASCLPPPVRAVVSRGGRPDLAGRHLPVVTAPTLLIVGSHDQQVLELNRRAAERLHCPTRIVLVEGATHLFEEPGALEQVAALAIAWFAEHLPASDGRPERTAAR